MLKILYTRKIEKFRNYLIEEEKTTSTVEKYLRDIKYFFSFVKGKTINKDVVIFYKNHLAEKYALSSANSMIAALNSFFKFCGDEKLCVKQYRLQRVVFCPAEKELTREEYFKLINTAQSKKNFRLSLIIQTICGTGIRVSELEHITVESLIKGEAIVNCKGKMRVVCIVAELKRKLLEYVDNQNIVSGPVFVTKTGAPLNRSNIWREMKNLCSAANVQETKIFPHNLRHLFAKTFYSKEKDIAKLADILGHESIDTTRIYIASTGSEYRRKIEDMKLVLY